MQFVKPMPFQEAVSKLGSQSPIGSKLNSEQRADVLPRNRRIVRPDAAPGHPREESVQRIARALEGLARQATRLARAAGCRDRFGSDDKTEHGLAPRCKERSSGIPGPLQVARPPACLGEVDQRLVVELAPADQGFQLRSGEPMDPRPEVQAGQPKVDPGFAARLRLRFRADQLDVGSALPALKHGHPATGVEPPDLFRGEPGPPPQAEASRP